MEMAKALMPKDVELISSEVTDKEWAIGGTEEKIADVGRMGRGWRRLSRVGRDGGRQSASMGRGRQVLKGTGQEGVLLIAKVNIFCNAIAEVGRGGMGWVGGGTGARAWGKSMDMRLVVKVGTTELGLGEGV
jgi:hypothetical protein